MTATKTRATKAPTAARKTAPRKTAPKRTAKPAAAASAATTEAPPAAATPKEKASTNPLVSAYAKSMGFMESTVTGVMGIPLTVVSTLGVPSDATDAAKDTQAAMAKGFTGAFDGVVSGVTGLAGKAPGMLGGMMASAAKFIP